MRFLPFVLWLCLFLIAFAGRAQEQDEVYGRPEREVFREKGVREVRVEQEQFYQGRPSITKHLEKRLVIDDRGNVIRRETGSFGTGLTHRHDKTYDEQGNTLTFTSYVRRSENNGTDGAKVPGPEPDWVPSERTRYRKIGREKAGTDRWNQETGKWFPQTTTRTYQKNDTTYSETRTLSYNSKNVSRHYQLGSNKNISRQDYLTYSPKGLGEPKYYYSRTENGKLAETGSVSFEMEMFHYFEKHPEKQLRIFGSKHSFNTLHDEVARKYPGTLEPNTTFTYDALGYLTEKNDYGTKITYERHPDGKLQRQKQVYSDGSGRVITYFYNEKGLVEKELSHYLDGKPEENRFYHYTFQ